MTYNRVFTVGSIELVVFTWAPCTVGALQISVQIFLIFLRLLSV